MAEGCACWHNVLVRVSGDKWWRQPLTVQLSLLLSALYWFAGALQCGSSHSSVQPCRKTTTAAHVHTNVLERWLHWPFIWCGLFESLTTASPGHLRSRNIRESPCNWISFPWLSKTFVGQRSLSSPQPLTVQALGNRVCLMCWQFHWTLPSLSLIVLASSVLTMASDCLSPYTPPPPLSPLGWLPFS